MTMHFRALAEQAAADGAISSEEVLGLRRAGWVDGKISPEEAEAIFLVNDRVAVPTAEWTDFFVEAISDFIVNGLEPRGYVNDEQGDWLIGRIDHNGRVDSMTELELLVTVIEKATNATQKLKDYVLAQIEAAVLTGEGPTRDGGSLEKGNVNEAEVRVLRRAIFAQAGDRPAAVSRHEAEMLFRLKDATLAANNAPEWKRLFVQGVGNYLTAYSSYTPLSTERATELEHFMDSPGTGLGGFFRRMAGSDVDDSLRSLFRHKPQRDHAAEEAAAHAVTGDEQIWLQGQMDANDTIDEFDQALLDFLAEEQRLG